MENTRHRDINDKAPRVACTDNPNDPIRTQNPTLGDVVAKKRTHSELNSGPNDISLVRTPRDLASNLSKEPLIQTHQSNTQLFHSKAQTGQMTTKLDVFSDLQGGSIYPNGEPNSQLTPIFPSHSLTPNNTQLGPKTITLDNFIPIFFPDLQTSSSKITLSVKQLFLLLSLVNCTKWIDIDVFSKITEHFVNFSEILPSGGSILIHLITSSRWAIYLDNVYQVCYQLGKDGQIQIDKNDTHNSTTASPPPPYRPSTLKYNTNTHSHSHPYLYVVHSSGLIEHFSYLLTSSGSRITVNMVQYYIPYHVQVLISHIDNIDQQIECLEYLFSQILSNCKNSIFIQHFYQHFDHHFEHNNVLAENYDTFPSNLSFDSIHYFIPELYLILKHLLKSGANPNQGHYYGYNLITLALSYEYLHPYIPLFLEFGANINAINPVKYTPLQLSMFAPHPVYSEVRSISEGRKNWKNCMVSSSRGSINNMVDSTPLAPQNQPFGFSYGIYDTIYASLLTQNVDEKNDPKGDQPNNPNNCSNCSLPQTTQNVLTNTNSSPPPLTQKSQKLTHISNLDPRSLVYKLIQPQLMTPYPIPTTENIARGVNLFLFQKKINLINQIAQISSKTSSKSAKIPQTVGNKKIGHVMDVAHPIELNMTPRPDIQHPILTSTSCPTPVNHHTISPLLPHHDKTGDSPHNDEIDEIDAIEIDNQEGNFVGQILNANHPNISNYHILHRPLSDGKDSPPLCLQCRDSNGSNKYTNKRFLSVSFELAVKYKANLNLFNHNFENIITTAISNHQPLTMISDLIKLGTDFNAIPCNSYHNSITSIHSDDKIIQTFPKRAMKIFIPPLFLLFLHQYPTHEIISFFSEMNSLINFNIVWKLYDNCNILQYLLTNPVYQSDIQLFEYLLNHTDVNVGHLDDSFRSVLYYAFSTHISSIYRTKYNQMKPPSYYFSHLSNIFDSFLESRNFDHIQGIENVQKHGKTQDIPHNNESNQYNQITTPHSPSTRPQSDPEYSPLTQYDEFATAICAVDVNIIILLNEKLSFFSFDFPLNFRNILSYLSTVDEPPPNPGVPTNVLVDSDFDANEVYNCGFDTTSQTGDCFGGNEPLNYQTVDQINNGNDHGDYNHSHCIKRRALINGHVQIINHADNISKHNNDQNNTKIKPSNLSDDDDEHKLLNLDQINASLQQIVYSTVDINEFVWPDSDEDYSPSDSEISDLDKCQNGFGLVEVHNGNLDSNQIHQIIPLKQPTSLSPNSDQILTTTPSPNQQNSNTATPYADISQCEVVLGGFNHGEPSQAKNFINPAFEFNLCKERRSFESTNKLDLQTNTDCIYLAYMNTHRYITPPNPNIEPVFMGQNPLGVFETIKPLVFVAENLKKYETSAQIVENDDKIDDSDNALRYGIKHFIDQYYSRTNGSGSMFMGGNYDQINEGNILELESRAELDPVHPQNGINSRPNDKHQTHLFPLSVNTMNNSIHNTDIPTPDNYIQPSVEPNKMCDLSNTNAKGMSCGNKNHALSSADEMLLLNKCSSRNFGCKSGAQSVSNFETNNIHVHTHGNPFPSVDMDILSISSQSSEESELFTLSLPNDPKKALFSLQAQQDQAIHGLLQSEDKSENCEDAKNAGMKFNFRNKFQENDNKFEKMKIENTFRPNENNFSTQLLPSFFTNIIYNNTSLLIQYHENFPMNTPRDCDIMIPKNEAIKIGLKGLFFDQENSPNKTPINFANVFQHIHNDTCSCQDYYDDCNCDDCVQLRKDIPGCYTFMPKHNHPDQFPPLNCPKTNQNIQTHHKNHFNHPIDHGVIGRHPNEGSYNPQFTFPFNSPSPQNPNPRDVVKPVRDIGSENTNEAQLESVCQNGDQSDNKTGQKRLNLPSLNLPHDEIALNHRYNITSFSPSRRFPHDNEEKSRFSFNSKNGGAVNAGNYVFEDMYDDIDEEVWNAVDGGGDMNEIDQMVVNGMNKCMLVDENNVSTILTDNDDPSGSNYQTNETLSTQNVNFFRPVSAPTKQHLDKSTPPLSTAIQSSRPNSSTSCISSTQPLPPPPLLPSIPTQNDSHNRSQSNHDTESTSGEDQRGEYLSVNMIRSPLSPRTPSAPQTGQKCFQFGHETTTQKPGNVPQSTSLFPLNLTKSPPTTSSRTPTHDGTRSGSVRMNMSQDLLAESPGLIPKQGFSDLNDKFGTNESNGYLNVPQSHLLLHPLQTLESQRPQNNFTTCQIMSPTPIPMPLPLLSSTSSLEKKPSLPFDNIPTQKIPTDLVKKIGDDIKPKRRASIYTFVNSNSNSSLPTVPIVEHERRGWNNINRSSDKLINNIIKGLKVIHLPPPHNHNMSQSQDEVIQFAKKVGTSYEAMADIDGLGGELFGGFHPHNTRPRTQGQDLVSTRRLDGKNNKNTAKMMFLIRDGMGDGFESEDKHSLQNQTPTCEQAQNQTQKQLEKLLLDISSETITSNTPFSKMTPLKRIENRDNCPELRRGDDIYPYKLLKALKSSPSRGTEFNLLLSLLHQYNTIASFLRHIPHEACMGYWVGKGIGVKCQCSRHGDDFVGKIVKKKSGFENLDNSFVKMGNFPPQVKFPIHRRHNTTWICGIDELSSPLEINGGIGDVDSSINQNSNAIIHVTGVEDIFLKNMNPKIKVGFGSPPQQIHSQQPNYSQNDLKQDFFHDNTSSLPYNSQCDLYSPADQLDSQYDIIKPPILTALPRQASHPPNFQSIPTPNIPYPPPFESTHPHLKPSELFLSSASTSSPKRSKVTQDKFPCCLPIIQYQDSLLLLIYLYLGSSPTFITLFSIVPAFVRGDTPVLPNANVYLKEVIDELLIFDTFFSNNFLLYQQLLLFSSLSPLTFYHLHVALTPSGNEGYDINKSAAIGTGENNGDIIIQNNTNPDILPILNKRNSRNQFSGLIPSIPSVRFEHGNFHNCEKLWSKLIAHTNHLLNFFSFHHTTRINKDYQGVISTLSTRGDVCSGLVSNNVDPNKTDGIITPHVTQTVDTVVGNGSNNVNSNGPANELSMCDTPMASLTPANTPHNADVGDSELSQQAQVMQFSMSQYLFYKDNTNCDGNK